MVALALSLKWRDYSFNPRASAWTSPSVGSKENVTIIGRQQIAQS